MTQPTGNSGEENLPFKTWGGGGKQNKRHTVEES